MSVVDTPVPDLEKGCLHNESTPSNTGLPNAQNPKEEYEEIARIPTQATQTQGRSKIATLAKTITARSNASVLDPGPAPDGGVRAWTQAFMGHFVIMNTWGMIASFGVFQTYYTSELGMEPSAVSWIGSMQMLGHFGFGMFSGRALDAGYFYWAVVPGMLFSALGMFLTSFGHQYYQFFLAQGVMMALGNGLQFTPCNTLITTYFDKRRSIALSIIATGSATGGLLYPTIVRELLPRIGFAWTVRAMSLIMVTVGTCYCSLLKPRLPPRKSGPLFEFSAFREAPYTLYSTGLFCLCLGAFFAFYYISSFAVNVVGVPYGTSINLLLIMNGVGVFGRLIPAYLSDHYFGPHNTMLPFCFLTSIILYCWAAVHTVTQLYIFAAFYGFFSAGFQGLFPAVLSRLTKDMSKAGTRNGMGFAFVGLASLTGTPVAGALIQGAGGSYFNAQMWGASMMFLGMLFILASRLCRTGFAFKVRA